MRLDKDMDDYVTKAVIKKLIFGSIMSWSDELYRAASIQI